MCIRDRDNLIQSAPRIETRIPGGRGQITGSFTSQDAKLLANILNSGNLQAPMTVVEERTVGCLLYTSDAADERSSVDLGGRRIIKKKT